MINRVVDFDAVVSIDDEAAWGVMDTLRANDIHVPNDVVVTGYDDIVGSQNSIPPLSTVRQPLREVGQQALDSIQEQLNGEREAQDITLATEMILRQSCGCLSPSVRHAQKMQTEERDLVTKTEDKNELIQRQEIIQENFLQALGSHPSSALQSVQEDGIRLLEGFYINQ